MTTKPNWNDPAMAACKGQLDGGLKMLEAIIEGTRKIHEAQLEAAVEAHAGAEATRKQLEGARDAQELWRIQSAWLSGCLNESLAYWRKLYEVALETQSCLAQCVVQQATTLAPGAPAATEAPMGAMLGIMDSAYKQWLEATRKAYALPTA